MIEGIEFQTCSGNVFAGLGRAEASKLKTKSGRVSEIARALHRLDLFQEVASRRMGVLQPKVPGMMQCDVANLCEQKLMECLDCLGYEIETKMRPASEPIGHPTLAMA
jgi:predicted XRE-type DNA-binding protein